MSTPDKPTAQRTDRRAHQRRGLNKGYTAYRNGGFVDSGNVHNERSGTDRRTGPADRRQQQDLAWIVEAHGERWNSTLDRRQTVASAPQGFGSIWGSGDPADLAPPAPPSAQTDVEGKILIQQSKTADTRSCDFSRVSKETLYASSVQHIGDVRKGLDFFCSMMRQSAEVHDHDKLSDIDGFHRDFVTGFAKTEWWDKHRKVNRHHLLNEDGVPADVSLIDVLDMIADCVMAGMARTGYVYPLNISDRILRDAFNNTVELLKSKVVVAGTRPEGR